MSDNILTSLETIRTDLKAKIDVLPEILALKRVEAAIEEVTSLMSLIGNLGLGSVKSPVNTAIEVASLDVEEVEDEADDDIFEAKPSQSIDLDALAAEITVPAKKVTYGR